MAQWTKVDEADGSPIWAASQLKQPPTRVAANLLYGNSTADAYTSGQTVGAYGLNKTEINQVHFHIISATPVDFGDDAYVVGDFLLVANTLAGDGNVHVEANLSVVTVEMSTVGVGASGGTGYANGDTVSVDTGTSSVGMVIDVETGAADTIATVLTIGNRGSYTVEPTLSDAATSFIIGSGTGLVVDLTMRMLDLAIVVPGVYTLSPNTTDNPVTGGTGTGGEITLVMSEGDSDGKLAGNPGWILRTVGTGGRAGRVTAECLVAVSSMEGDTDGDDTILPEFPDQS